MVWVGEGFQNNQDLPIALPPVDAPQPMPLGIFRAVHSTTGEGANINATRVDFRESVIDVKPGIVPNDVNPRSKGVIPVAVLGSVELDALQVDFSTVTFGPGAARPVHDGHVEDVNDDGFVDMVFHFNTQDTGIACGDTEASLTGRTSDDPAVDAITGTNSVNTVGCQ